MDYTEKIDTNLEEIKSLLKNKMEKDIYNNYNVESKLAYDMHESHKSVNKKMMFNDMEMIDESIRKSYGKLSKIINITIDELSESTVGILSPNNILEYSVHEKFNAYNIRFKNFIYCYKSCIPGLALKHVSDITLTTNDYAVMIDIIRSTIYKNFDLMYLNIKNSKDALEHTGKIEKRIKEKLIEFEDYIETIKEVKNT